MPTTLTGSNTRANWPATTEGGRKMKCPRCGQGMKGKTCACGYKEKAATGAKKRPWKPVGKPKGMR